MLLYMGDKLSRWVIDRRRGLLRGLFIVRFWWKNPPGIMHKPFMPFLAFRTPGIGPGYAPPRYFRFTLGGITLGGGLAPLCDVFSEGKQLRIYNFLPAVHSHFIGRVIRARRPHVPTHP